MVYQGEGAGGLPGGGGWWSTRGRGLVVYQGEGVGGLPGGGGWWSTRPGQACSVTSPIY